MKKILLVEDEKNIAESLLFNLEVEYEADWAKTGEEALEKWRSGGYDLIILDVMLPKLSGYDVIKEIRGKDTQTPVLFLTAKGDVKDRIHGLELGADDYLGKPFELDEFLLRTKALLKRGEAGKAVVERFRFGRCEIDFENFIAIVDKRKIELTPKEAYLLKILVENEDRVVSRDKILKEVWGYETTPSTRTVDNFVARLRTYFEVSPKSPLHIHSVHGIGYKFTR